MRNMITVILTLALLAGCCFPATAADTSQAKLYSYYGNNMLFKQMDEAVFAGTATAGSGISCTVFDADKQQIAFSETLTNRDGTFAVSFMAPKGSFEEYTVTLKENGVTFAQLSGIVFGELWLAGGQSNMQMPLAQSKTGMEMFANGQRGSDALRVLYVPYNGTYKGDASKAPVHPLTDYESASGWYKGSDAKVYDMSAVGYYFAEELIRQLNMPVGILNANLGGTSILTWLSRETIENNSTIMNDCQSDGRYIAADKWKEGNINFGMDMTCNFNTKIAPLKNFRLSGMIWYQGESDLFWQYGRYSRAFDALQSSYTEYFKYKNGLLPIVFTQLASYHYGDLIALQNKNVEFAEIQQQQPDSRAMTSIYDVPLDYTSSTHAIHPLCKKEVGEKMTYAALGLVYDRYDTFTAATVKNIITEDDCIYVSFRDTADGLMADGNQLRGFSICGSDGIYVSADAEIVSPDTVRVFNKNVKSPVSVAYAYSQSNHHANLFASLDGKKSLAVSPFVTDLSVGKHYWHNDAWTSCDYSSFWHCHSNEFSGFYNTWKANGATISFKDSTIGNGNALYVSANGNSEQFSVLPNFTYSENGKEVCFSDIDTNWSDYGCLSITFKTNSNKAIRFDGLKIKINNGLWVMPAILGSDATGCELRPEDNAVQVTLDLNRLYPYGNIAMTAYSANLLNSVQYAEFLFTDLFERGADLCIDDLQFVSDATERENISEKQDLSKAENFFEKIRAFFLAFFVKLILIFR